MGLKEARERVRGGERPDHVFVCGSLGVERFHDRNLNSWIASLDRQKIGIGALDTGAWVLADAGILDGRRCAIHWESLPAFSERFPEAQVFADLFEADGNCYTCAGGTASLDMMLHLIGEHLDEQIVTKVCEQALTDRMRSPTDRQRLPLRARLGLQNTKLLTIIEMMEANIPEPLSLVEVAKYAGLSRRQIERLFRKNLGRSPARYYLEIRLDRARHLLIQSDAAIVEVAVACGFVSASHFSKCYRELYGRSPQQERHGREKLLA
jgi:transcriptional regulator GlxA family with amidase domain